MHSQVYTSFKDALTNNEKLKIVYLGDSITSCEWVHPNWPSIVRYVLEEEFTKDLGDWKGPSWGLRMFNAGLNGGTSEDMLDYLGEYVLSQKPAMLMYVISSNDRHYEFGNEQFANNLRILLDRTKEIPHRVVLSTISSHEETKQGQMDGYYGELSEIFPQPGVQFVDLYSLSHNFPKDRIYTFKLSEGEEFGDRKAGDIDPFHPNRLGNAYIAHAVLKEVFGVDFDPEKFMRDTFDDLKYPQY